MSGLKHKIAVFLSGFKKRPFVRRSAWISKYAVVPKSCVLGERVKLKCEKGEAIVLGEYCFLNDDVTIWGNVELGAGTRVMPKSFIQNCSHDADDITMILCADKNVKIGRNVVIDACCSICKGVTIGDGAIIQPGSVVVDDVPANAVVSGNPAKFVEFRNNSVVGKG